jgi:agmatinase
MFPGASASRENAAYALFGAPLDVSTSYQPGTRFGPAEMRQVAQSFEDFDHHTGQRFTDLAVYDHGDIRPGDDADSYLTFLEGELSESVDGGQVPVLLGGEHTVTIAALRVLDPDLYVCLDAHLDLRESYAGNPLSHATVTHHALEIADRAVVLGARSGSKAEWERANTSDAITFVEPQHVDEWTVSDTDEDVYLSVDIDAADPGYAPGTGTCEPYGLDPQTMHDVVRDLADDCVGFDVVEVNDRDHGQAATLGAKLIRDFVFSHASARSDP